MARSEQEIELIQELTNILLEGFEESRTTQEPYGYETTMGNTKIQIQEALQVVDGELFLFTDEPLGIIVKISGVQHTLSVDNSYFSYLRLG